MTRLMLTTKQILDHIKISTVQRFKDLNTMHLPTLNGNALPINAEIKRSSNIGSFLFDITGFHDTSIDSEFRNICIDDEFVDYQVNGKDQVTSVAIYRYRGDDSWFPIVSYGLQSNNTLQFEDISKMIDPVDRMFSKILFLKLNLLLWTNNKQRITTTGLSFVNSIYRDNVTEADHIYNFVETIRYTDKSNLYDHIILQKTNDKSVYMESRLEYFSFICEGQVNRYIVCLSTLPGRDKVYDVSHLNPNKPEMRNFILRLIQGRAE